ncbi:protein adenylyltransferase SelO family protein [Corynebacterium phocae]|uniref:protein adenylyltransferase SelO family protein n=1 Tax=Corynebacterium phocae TaxID=161895 RepID=UPI003CCC09AC
MKDPMRPEITHEFATQLPEMAAQARGEEQPSPELVVLNVDLAASLGLDPEWLRSSEGLDFLLGHGTAHAMAYSGYQFGQFNPHMGDGRALLLGEVGGRDLHAKGTGRTPYSRHGSDGRGTLRSMLREYLMSEAMHALGVPTTRGLAVIATGRKIQRQIVEPAGVHVRVAASHIRVGSFHFAARDSGLLQRLADYTIARHYPGSTYRELYTQAMDAQIATVAAWQRLGFIHGVMNTDNTTLSGETIDYGPCAFMETYDPDTWFSSIDTQGRYRFGQQPAMLGWNLARLAESLLPLFDSGPNRAVEFAQETINGFYGKFERQWHGQLATRLGISADAVPGYLAAVTGHDLTNFNAGLNSGGAGLAPEWEQRWREESSFSTPDPAQRFHRVIPRNLNVEAALADIGEFHRLLDAVTHPYQSQPEYEQPGDLSTYRTFCGT